MHLLPKNIKIQKKNGGEEEVGSGVAGTYFTLLTIILMTSY